VTSTRVVVTVCVATVLYAALPLRDGRWWIAGLVGIAAIGAVVPMAFRRIAGIESARHPMLAAAEAIVLLLTMVVYGFSALYLVIDRRAGQFDGIETRLDAAYFTVTTLSTVGFGDISATGQAARLAVTLQILFDLTLLAVTVRVLMNAAHARRATADQGP
jgi:voltage-gated potassium channel